MLNLETHFQRRESIKKAIHSSILGKLRGQKSLAHCSPWSHTTEHARMRGEEGDGLVAKNRTKIKLGAGGR